MMESLLESDRFMSALSDNEGEEIVTPNRSAIKTIRKCFDSEMGSEDEG